ncbi:MAG TPA: hypothetical protein PLF89_11060, partial [bacterium]|nr:hypothetical protein [bacterium]
MNKVFRIIESLLIAALVLTAWLSFADARPAPVNGTLPKDTKGRTEAPLVLQTLDYTENPVDIPNPDRGPYRGRWQN